MKALVTGGAGFIGSHTVDLLLTQGYSVRVLDNLEPPVHPSKTKPAYVPDDVEFVLGDVRSRDDFQKALQGVDCVVHLAAHQGYLKDFGTFAHTNGYGTALLYEIIVSEHLPVRRVVIASSQATYGEGKYQCATHGVQYPPLRPFEQLQRGDWDLRCAVCGEKMQPLPADEAKTNPHNQYAISKYTQELYSLILGRRFDIPTVALRYSIAQGARQSFYNAYSGILRIFSLRLLNGRAPVIYEDGQQQRDYVSVKDVARANALALKSGAVDYEVFNVGGAATTTVAEYSSMLTALVGKPIQPEIGGNFRFGDSRHITSDITKLKNVGWEPEIPLEQAAVEYLEWVGQQSETFDHYQEAEQVMKQQGVIESVKR